MSNPNSRFMYSIHFFIHVRNFLMVVYSQRRLLLGGIIYNMYCKLDFLSMNWHWGMLCIGFDKANSLFTSWYLRSLFLLTCFKTKVSIEHLPLRMLVEVTIVSICKSFKNNKSSFQTQQHTPRLSHCDRAIAKIRLSSFRIMPP